MCRRVESVPSGGGFVNLETRILERERSADYNAGTFVPQILLVPPLRMTLGPGYVKFR